MNKETYGICHCFIDAKAERRRQFIGWCCRGEHHPVTSEGGVMKTFRSVRGAGRERVLEVIFIENNLVEKEYEGEKKI